MAALSGLIRRHGLLFRARLRRGGQGQCYRGPPGRPAPTAAQRMSECVALTCSAWEVPRPLGAPATGRLRGCALKGEARGLCKSDVGLLKCRIVLWKAAIRDARHPRSRCGAQRALGTTPHCMLARAALPICTPVVSSCRQAAGLDQAVRTTGSTAINGQRPPALQSAATCSATDAQAQCPALGYCVSQNQCMAAPHCMRMRNAVQCACMFGVPIGLRAATSCRAHRATWLALIHVIQPLARIPVQSVLAPGAR